VAIQVRNPFPINLDRSGCDKHPVNNEKAMCKDDRAGWRLFTKTGGATGTAEVNQDGVKETLADIGQDAYIDPLKQHGARAHF
jgi:hypothetical protein